MTAEYGAIDEDWIYPTPDGSPTWTRPRWPSSGSRRTSGCSIAASLKQGETVYVSGGSGGVGSMVVQMAKAAGARVATTAGSAKGLDLCRHLGADLAIDYSTEDVPAAIREFAEEGIDVWYETQREPDLETTIPLLRKRGRMILMAGRTAKPALPLGSFYPRNCSLLGFAMFNAHARRAAPLRRRHQPLAIEGKLRPIVGRVFPLDAAAEAHRFLEDNTLGWAGTLDGKIVIEI